MLERVFPAIVDSLFYAQVGILCIWLALGRTRWPLRLSGSLAAFLIQILIGSLSQSKSELQRNVVISICQSITIVALLVILRRKFGHPNCVCEHGTRDVAQPAQFTLRDTLLWIVVASESIAAGRLIQPLHLSMLNLYWMELAGFGGILGAIALLCALAILQHRKNVSVLVLIGTLMLPLGWLAKGLYELWIACALLVSYFAFIAVALCLVKWHTGRTTQAFDSAGPATALADTKGSRTTSGTDGL